MRPARSIVSILGSILVLSACSSAKQATSTPPTSPVASSAAVGIMVTPTPPPAPSTTPARPTPRPVAATPKRTTAARPTVPKPVARPRVTTDPLTGGAISTNPVIAAKIDNVFFGVPQFGLSAADVVFVEQVEGGLTRIIAVFHTSMPTEVGPVRSVRSTDAQLLPVFGRPALVFSGGAGGPLAALAATSIVDTSGLADAYFRSDVATGTHNLHANLVTVAAQARGLTPARSIGFHFVPQSPVVAAGRPVSSLRVVMEAGETDFAYRGGRYVRMRNGAQMSDYQGGVEAADNVLLMNVIDTPDGTVDTNGQPSYLTKTVGAGRLSLYRNGRVIAGTWRRDRPGDPFTFKDAAGGPLPMKPGKTWVMLAPPSAQVGTN